MEQMETEVLIIGGGVLGAAVARELSKYKVDVILVEKEADLGWGSTKTNICIVCQGGRYPGFPSRISPEQTRLGQYTFNGASLSGA
jgi:L-2-hydroxyglutarate oxidase LhgO